jgi:hypothetical protein
VASKRSQILEFFRTTVLKAIKKTDGFNFDAKMVERGWRHPEGLTSFPALFITATTEKRKNLTIGSNREFIAEPLSVVIAGYVKNGRPNPKADQSGVQLDLDKLIEDVEKACYEDVTLGGLATGLEISSVQTDYGDLAPVAGCEITVDVNYVEEGRPS